jgi:hypothetical protein
MLLPTDDSFVPIEVSVEPTVDRRADMVPAAAEV